jgi:DNA adenine methylase
MNHGLIPYIGGKYRLASRLVEICAATSADTFVDVFGGSAAVLLAAAGKFKKLIYNDIDGDLVNLFRVVADDKTRRELFRILRWLPPSRKIFNDDHEKYIAGGFSFASCSDPVERARRTFYRHCFAFGGKVRCGGFAISTGDENRIKEVSRYRNTLRKLVRVGDIFRSAMIENLHYSELLRIHGRTRAHCLFVDPPYDGTEDVYSRSFGPGDHTFLAEQLTSIPGLVVCTYYDTPLIRSLYPESRWNWHSIAATKNSCLTRGNKVITAEFVIIKK